ncbi:hypothetical protein PG996_006397 [Apiospora saccharicola]|uniref:Uncharacterized protein n=1 Tax=Apiospora saccharicola TaxID=335842 RepID=A0ABR1VP72_9PEZI
MLSSGTFASTTPPPPPQETSLEGTILPPAGLRLGSRTEQRAHCDTYQVIIPYKHAFSSDLLDQEIVPFLSACVFFLNDVPQKVRKHRLRCMRRLEFRKVFETRGDGCRILVLQLDSHDDNKLKRFDHEIIRQAILDYVNRC